jgi:hypothetical protein
LFLGSVVVDVDDYDHKQSSIAGRAIYSFLIA